MDEAEVAEQVSPETERAAAQRAKDRANVARWNLELAVLSFAILIVVMILLSQEIEIEIVASVAIFGLAMVWLMGWRRGTQLYQRFYDEELSKLEQEPKKVVKEAAEETIEEKVQRALRDRWR